MIDTNFPRSGCLPKESTGASQFLTKYPFYDGRSVTIAIIDTGIDPLAVGLQKTTTDKVKIIDLRDSTGSGDVDISTIVKVSSNDENQDKIIEGLSGRKLKIPSTWINPSGEYHLGIKPLKHLLPKNVFERILKERKEKWFDPEHRRQLNEAERNYYEHLNKYSSPNEEEKLLREELQSMVESLKDFEKKYFDPGPYFDCLVWNDGERWIASIDTSEQGDLQKSPVLTNYIDSHQTAQFGSIDMVTYSVQIHHEINILEIVVAGGSHGTHVGAIAAAFISENNDENGVAPGSQLLSINIGDHRLSTMETIPSLVRAIKYCIDYKVDIINMSYGEDFHIPNIGRVQELFNEVVEKHGIIFVSSAGNNGPALSTTGAPGASCSNLIGVGAHVTPEMQLAEYGLRESTGSISPYTWSSRGPCSDGWLGVSISAPGAAITSVPQFNLYQRQLMNGTSMSSPNAAGCIALLVSALKQENIDYNPFLIRLALENTAQKLDDEFSVGYGLIQIHKAFEFFLSLSRPNPWSNISLSMIGGQGRGIYLRDFHQVQKSSGDIRLTIRTKFISKRNDDETSFQEQKKKIDFHCRLSLVVEPPVGYVQHGKYLDLSFNDRTIDIRIDPSTLKEDQVYFSQLQSYDINQIQLGPLTRFPITIIKPIRIHDPTKSIEFKGQTFKPGQIRRHFIEAPSGSTFAVFEMKNLSVDLSCQMNFHFVQLESSRSFRENETEKMIRLDPKCQIEFYFNVKQNRTIEFCLARWWSSLAIIESDYSIRFFSFDFSPSRLIQFSSSQYYKRIQIENHFDIQNQEMIGPPTVQWKHLVQTLKANKEESKIFILSNRDCLPQQRQIHQLILVFYFSLLKSSEIQVKCPYLHEFLYDNEYEGAFWMCFDSNKQYIAAGDVFKDYSFKLDKGDFVIRMSIRHEKVEMLEKLLKDNSGSGISIHLEHKMIGLPSLDCYQSSENLLQSTKKLSTSTVKFLPGQPINIFMQTINEDKIPKIISSLSGTFLRGTIHLPINEKIKKLDIAKIEVYLTEPICSSSSNSSKKYSNSNNSTKKKDFLLSNSTSDEQIKQYNESLRDFKISWIPKLIDEQGEIYKELVEQQDLKEHIPLHLARLQQLENQLKSIDLHLKQEKLNEICRFIENILFPLIDEDSILKYFGQKSNTNSNEKENQSTKIDMEKRRNYLIDIYLSWSNVLLEMTIKDKHFLDQLEKIIKYLQKHIDLNDSKYLQFIFKFNLTMKFYGKAWKILLKQIEDKNIWSQQEIDEKLLQLYQKLERNNLILYQQRIILAKYKQNFVLF